MKNFKPGTEIKIPCSISSGAFTGEYLVTIPLDGGEISGFVPQRFISNVGAGSAYIFGMIEEVAESVLTVRIPGSFFTSAGIADISQTWAKKHAVLS